MYAGNNNFQTLPKNIGWLAGLEELDVSGCAIEYLPESLSQCTALKRLWLSNNRYAQHSVKQSSVLGFDGGKAGSQTGTGPGDEASVQSVTYCCW